MIKQIASLTFIYLSVCMAWLILGSTVSFRTDQQMKNLCGQVKGLWGNEQKQAAPYVVFDKTVEEISKTSKGEIRKSIKHVSEPVSLKSSDVNVDLALEQRKKGLLWYPTYKVKFNGVFGIANDSNEERAMKLTFGLPDREGIYDNLKLQVANETSHDLHPENGALATEFKLAPHQEKLVQISYDSQGMNSWQYTAGDGLNLVKKFSLTMNTNFDAVDFPDGTRSPTQKTKEKNGWKLNWKYDNTMTGNAIGMSMPKLINPGPLVQDVTFFAPVSLFFFFYVTWLTSTIRVIKLHPMHYFFIGAAFFSFHLLLAYSVDHIPLEWSFAICSVVSVFLVMSYVSRFIPDRRFVQQLGVSQFIYLVLFSYTFFLEQFTGLIITCLSIATLFLSMQYTSKIDWTRLFSGKSSEDSDLKLIEEYDSMPLAAAAAPVPASIALPESNSKEITGS